MVDLKSTKNSHWIAVNKLFLNAAKTTFMRLDNYETFVDEDHISYLTIDDIVNERVTEFNF